MNKVILVNYLFQINKNILKFIKLFIAFIIVNFINFIVFFTKISYLIGFRFFLLQSIIQISKLAIKYYKKVCA